MKNLINIVGMYKCGTSWLLSALCAHPELVGIREFDLVRASVETIGAKRLFGLLGGKMKIKPLESRCDHFFAKSPFCRVDRAVVESCARLSTQQALEKFCQNKGHAQWNGQGRDRKSAEVFRPQTFFDLHFEDACTLYDCIKNAKNSQRLFDGFCYSLLKLAQSPSALVLKAADQVAVYDRLKMLSPESKDILIIRDGRDAAISAKHYRALMAKDNAPWYTGEKGYWSLLKGWNDRAGKVRYLLEKNELFLLRYEDLTLDFAKTFKPLLDWLDLESSESIIRDIQDRTSFEAVTGRKRGEEADAVIRKGAICEWVEELGEEEKNKAWELAGENLEFFGYTKHGEIKPFSH